MERVYRITGGRWVELESRDPNKLYRCTLDPSGVSCMLELTGYEQKSREREEARRPVKPLPKPTLEEKVDYLLNKLGVDISDIENP